METGIHRFTLIIENLSGQVAARADGQTFHSTVALPREVVVGQVFPLELTPSGVDGPSVFVEGQVAGIEDMLDGVTRVVPFPGMRLHMVVVGRSRIASLPMPIANNDVRANQSSTASPSYDEQSPLDDRDLTGVIGTLRQVSLIEVIQGLEMGRKTAIVEVRPYETSAVARVMLEDGQVVGCEFDDDVGETAFYKLARVVDGTYRIRFHRPSSTRNISTSTTGLILDTLRRFDEDKRDGVDGDMIAPVVDANGLSLSDDETTEVAHPGISLSMEFSLPPSSSTLSRTAPPSRPAPSVSPPAMPLDSLEDAETAPHSASALEENIVEDTVSTPPGFLEEALERARGALMPSAEVSTDAAPRSFLHRMRPEPDSTTVRAEHFPIRSMNLPTKTPSGIFAAFFQEAADARTPSSASGHAHRSPTPPRRPPPLPPMAR